MNARTSDGRSAPCGARTCRRSASMRLDALRLHPRAYGSSYEEEVATRSMTLPRAGRSPPGVMLGGFVADRLVGFAGLQVLPEDQGAAQGLHLHRLCRCGVPRPGAGGRRW